MSDDPYVYPGSSVLKNKIGLTSQAELDEAERLVSTTRALQGIPTGQFDLAHLQAIHRHLFQDIYDWAGKLRTVEISKGGHQFMFRQFIHTGMADVHRRIVANGFFVGLEAEVFSEQVGPIIGDVNYVHPFREGNGRTQLQYLKQLCEQAGHYLDLRCIDAEGWMAASRRAHHADYRPMSAALGDALAQSRRIGV
jgi:cell filamentation protein